MTTCIEVTMEENPLDVIKGVSCLLSELDGSFSENIYSTEALEILGDLLTDATSRLDKQLNKMSKK